MENLNEYINYIKNNIEFLEDVEKKMIDEYLLELTSKNDVKYIKESLNALHKHLFFERKISVYDYSAWIRRK